MLERLSVYTLPNARDAVASAAQRPQQTPAGSSKKRSKEARAVADAGSGMQIAVSDMGASTFARLEFTESFDLIVGPGGGVGSGLGWGGGPGGAVLVARVQSFMAA
jgi:hypothetical protein